VSVQTDRFYHWRSAGWYKFGHLWAVLSAGWYKFGHLWAVLPLDVLTDITNARKKEKKTDAIVILI